MGFLRNIIAADQQYRQMSAASEEKRRISREKRLKARREAIAAAEKEIGTFDRYVRGMTGEQLLKERKRAARIAREREAAKELTTWQVLRGRTGADVLRARREIAREQAWEREGTSAQWEEEQIARAELRRSIPWWRSGADADRIVRDALREEKRLHRKRRGRDSFASDGGFEED